MAVDTIPAQLDLLRTKAYVDGEWIDADSGETILVDNPATGETIAEVPRLGAAETRRAIEAAAAAFPGWSGLVAKERARILRAFADSMMAHQEDLAVLMTLEQGKPLAESRAEIAYAASFFEWFGEEAKRVYGDTIPAFAPGRQILVLKQPVGVTVGITPWNFPAAMITRKAAPALAAGCTMVAKPSDYSPASAVELAALMDEAGFPPGVFNVVTGFGPAVGKALAAHPDVDKIAFTGSTLVGAEVAKAAAQNITGVLLELGGKSAHVVFDDADLDAACNGVLAGVFAATGQTCMAGSRLLVARPVHDALVERIADRARSIRLGDPRAAETEMGPVATEPQYRKVLSFLAGAVTEGATVAAGGRPDDGLGGFFVQPTVLTGVKPTMTVACEEVFGPVLSVIPFDTEEEAVALANDSRYGLAGAVWTKDIHRGHRVAHALRTGTVWINAYRVVGPDVPFGGYGLSGLGRENGIEAVHEYTQTKAIWVELTGGTRDPFTLG